MHAGVSVTLLLGALFVYWLLYLVADGPQQQAVELKGHLPVPNPVMNSTREQVTDDVRKAAPRSSERQTSRTLSGVPGHVSTALSVECGTDGRPGLCKCKELFTISPPISNSAHYSKVKTITERLQRYRDDDFGGATDPYEQLSRLLPSLIMKSNIASTSENYSSGVNINMTKNRVRFPYSLLPHTRLSLLNGSLPHVPCRVKQDYGTDEVTECLRSVISNRGSYYIAMLGDSKIRDLFLTFLVNTRQFDYTVQQENVSLSLPATLAAILMDRHLWVSKHATASRLPGLRVSLLFEPFNFMHESNARQSKTFRLMSEWINNSTAAPDLLIVGYGQWMFYLMAEYKAMPIGVLRSLDYLWGVHGAVLRILLQLPSRTRVLVQSQTRPRRTARTEYTVRQDVNNPANMEWSESLFLARMRHYALKRQQRNNGHTYTIENLLKNYYGGDLKQKIKNMAKKVSSASLKQFNNENYIKFLSNLPEHLKVKIYNGSTHFNQTQISNKYEKNSVNDTKPGVVLNPDLRVGAGVGPSVWYWDTQLPLNIATIRDCKILYDSDPETADLIPWIMKYKTRVIKYAYLLHKIGVDPSIYLEAVVLNSPHSFTTEYTTPAINASNGNFTIVDKVLNKKIPQSTSAINAKSNFSIADFIWKDKKNEYIDKLAMTYASPSLNCLDDLHAGTSTNDVEVIQLINLICNKHLKSDTRYCCN